MKLLIIVTIVVIALLLAPRLLAGEIIPAQDAADRVKAGTAVLVDVREPAEWADSGVAAPAALLSLSDLRGERTQWKTFLEQNKDKELILYCRSGNRSGIAANILEKEGFKVANAGGFKHWAGAGLPVRQIKQD
ncbi:MAG: rhodanese-like domain-containing protein [Opitutaceae bacterium]|nr:rhodanese-like domain-containing protein [Cephaloticoccus sp.]MCP5529473.1 rhodanese-like domain-containing protein [Opitutaceae bacterium]